MPKVLVIGQTPPPYGGQSINIKRMLDAFDKSSLEYRFLRMNFSEEMNETGKTSVKKIRKLISLFFSILSNLIFYRPNYVYYPPSGPEKVPVIRDMVVLSLIRLFGKKVIFHFHAGGLPEIYPSLPPVLQKMFNFCFKNVAYGICLNQSGTKDPIYLGIKDIEVIPNGVDNLISFKQPRPHHIFNVLFVGVCRETKGIIDYVSIIRRANELNPTIKGIVVGKIFGEKEQKAIDEGVSGGFIEYMGIKTGDDKNNIFGKSQAFLFPTFFEHENFPTVILEAFSCAIPVVATKWRGVVDQIQDGFNGYKHEVHDIESAALSLVKMSQDAELYNALSIGARKSYEDFYSIESFETSITKFFKKLK